jgi:hypothetical protein
MSSHCRCILVVSIVLLCAGCPSGSNLQLAGDSRIVGTWESDVVLMGYHIHTQSTRDANGNFMLVMSVQEDGSVGTKGGKWYADSQNGLYDSVTTWTSPSIPEAHGTNKGFYEVNGDTLYTWGNPVNMARPNSPQDAAVYQVHTRIQNKAAFVDCDVIEQPGIADWLLEHAF